MREWAERKADIDRSQLFIANVNQEYVDSGGGQDMQYAASAGVKCFVLVDLTAEIPEGLVPPNVRRYEYSSNREFLAQMLNIVRDMRAEAPTDEEIVIHHRGEVVKVDE